MALWKLTKNKFRLSQKFGNKLFINWIDIYFQSWLKWHNWIDYATPSDTELLAAFDGKAEVVDQWKKWYWLHIKIYKTRPDGISEIIYAHLNSTNIKTWDEVKCGDIIGKSGWDKSSKTSGTSTGAHLHFWLRFRNSNNEILNFDNWYKGWIDPLPFFIP